MEMDFFRRMFSGRPLVLASKSPRREALLRMLGLEFAIYSTEVEETIDPGLPPATIVQKLAQRKAAAAARAFPKAFVIAADTLVVLDQEILGKPVDAEEAKRMLRQLSGRTHQVFTGYTLLATPQNEAVSGCECTKVTFYPMTDDEIDAYVATEHPIDKAGAYGIQDPSAIFIKSVEGCFYNVVGFPIASFYRTSRSFLSRFNSQQNET